MNINLVSNRSFHNKVGNHNNTATKIFLAAYIKLCYDLCDSFWSLGITIGSLLLYSFYFTSIQDIVTNHMLTNAVDV